VYDSCDVEDVDTTGEDHIYDELRYVCMERPISPLSIPADSRVFEYDPLEINGSYTQRAQFTI
jgi:hypothetical protein